MRKDQAVQDGFDAQMAALARVMHLPPDELDGSDAPYSEKWPDAVREAETECQTVQPSA